MADLSRARACAILVGVSLLFPMGAASPAQAVTCEEVRAMSAAEIDYWAKRFEVSPDYLDALLKTAFCDARRAQPVIASTSKPKADKAR